MIARTPQGAEKLLWSVKSEITNFGLVDYKLAIGANHRSWINDHASPRDKLPIPPVRSPV